MAVMNNLSGVHFKPLKCYFYTELKRMAAQKVHSSV